MRAVPYDPSAAGMWDELVLGSRTSHFFFCRGYMDYHADRFEDASLLFYREQEERPLACLPASVAGDTVVSHGGLTFGGVVSGEAMTTRRMLAAFEALLEHYAGRGCRRLVYKPAPHIYHSVPAEEDLYALFRHDARLVRRDLSSTLRMTRRGAYRKGRRASVKRSRSQDLGIARSFDFERFMELEAQALGRRHQVAPVHSGAEMRMLAERFPENIKLFTAQRGDELLAGVVTFETPTVAHAQYIGAGEEGLAAGSLDAIVDHLLEEEFAGKRFFDFGISTEQDGRHLNEGLARNKESFGASATVYDWYELDLAA